MRAMGCFVAGLVLLAASAAAAEWSQWRGGPERNGVVPDPAPVFANPTKIALEEVWKVPMPGEGEGNYSSAVVAGDRVYAYVSEPPAKGAKKGSPSRDRFVCLALKDGLVLWEKEYTGTGGGKKSCNTPCVYEDKMIGIAAGGTVYCLNRQTGEELWKRQLEGKGNTDSSVTVVDGKVVVAFNGLCALDLNSGEVVWRKADIECSAGSPVVWRHIDKSYIVAGASHLHLVNPADGRVLWKIDNAGTGRTTPCIAGDVLAASVAKDKKNPDAQPGLHLYRLALDAPQTIKVIPVKIIFQMPSADGERVYLINSCHDAGTGEAVWRKRGVIGDHYASFMVVGNTLISWSAPHRKPMGEGESRLGFYRADTGEEIAVCDVTRLGECSFPAVAGDRLVFRGKESLWCYRVVQR